MVVGSNLWVLGCVGDKSSLHAAECSCSVANTRTAVDKITARFILVWGVVLIFVGTKKDIDFLGVYFNFMFVFLEAFLNSFRKFVECPSHQRVLSACGNPKLETIKITNLKMHNVQSQNDS